MWPAEGKTVATLLRARVSGGSPDTRSTWKAIVLATLLRYGRGGTDGALRWPLPGSPRLWVWDRPARLRVPEDGELRWPVPLPGGAQSRRSRGWRVPAGVGVELSTIARVQLLGLKSRAFRFDWTLKRRKTPYGQGDRRCGSRDPECRPPDVQAGDTICGPDRKKRDCPARCCTGIGPADLVTDALWRLWNLGSRNRSCGTPQWTHPRSPAGSRAPRARNRSCGTPGTHTGACGT